MMSHDPDSIWRTNSWNHLGLVLLVAVHGDNPVVIRAVGKSNASIRLWPYPIFGRERTRWISGRSASSPRAVGAAIVNHQNITLMELAHLV